MEAGKLGYFYSLFILCYLFSIEQTNFSTIQTLFYSSMAVNTHIPHKKKVA